MTELADIAEACLAHGIDRDRLGFCLDAAHAWAAGIDLSDPAATDRFLADFDGRIGLDRLVMIHLNDSKSELGSRVDRHEHLGAGGIGVAGLRHLLVHPSLAHVTYYLETPGMDEGYDAINVARARDIAAGRPLAALPPEALEVVSGRARLGPPAEPLDDADATATEGRRRVTTLDRRRLVLIGVPLGLLVLAAFLRLPDLATRGTWDSDQGHDMLVLRAFVRDGVVPLLGPPTSIGDVHHGALYYYLLSPAALLTGGDSPLAVVALIALAGIAAVLVTWWLARDIGGPVAGLVAGLAMAVSASAVDESTFIWNPNLIALSSAIALAGAWRAWTTRDPRWWLLRRASARRSRCNATSWASRSCRSSAASSSRTRGAGGRAPAATGLGVRAGGSRDRGAELPPAGGPRADQRLLARSARRSTTCVPAAMRRRSGRSAGS